MIEGRRGQVGTAMAGLAVVLLVGPALFPVQPVLYHETWTSSSMTPAEAEQAGVNVVYYENLSDRGQELYRTTLENGGEHYVDRGEGAPEFRYLTDEQRRQAVANGTGPPPGTVLVVRPEDDSGLPPADERSYVDPEAVGAVDEDGEVNETKLREVREEMRRYDAMDTYRGPPPLNAPAQLLRLGATVLAVVFLGCGGYLLALPRRE
jgi:hypothetical protein